VRCCRGPPPRSLLRWRITLDEIVERCTSSGSVEVAPRSRFHRSPRVTQRAAKPLSADWFGPVNAGFEADGRYHGYERRCVMPAERFVPARATRICAEMRGEHPPRASGASEASAALPDRSRAAYTCASRHLREGRGGIIGPRHDRLSTRKRLGSRTRYPKRADTVQVTGLTLRMQELVDIVETKRCGN